MSKDRFEGAMYILIFSAIYGLLNELVAYSELFMEYEQWSIVHPIGRMLIYLFPGIIAYIVFWRGYRYLMVLYLDIFLVSLGVIWEGCRFIYVLFIWGVVRYGYVGLILVWLFRYLSDLGFVDCESAIHWDFVFLVGLFGSVLVLIIMIFVNLLTRLAIDWIAKLMKSRVIGK